MRVRVCVLMLGKTTKEINLTNHQDQHLRVKCGWKSRLQRKTSELGQQPLATESRIPLSVCVSFLSVLTN